MGQIKDKGSYNPINYFSLIKELTNISKFILIYASSH